MATTSANPDQVMTDLVGDTKLFIAAAQTPDLSPGLVDLKERLLRIQTEEFLRVMDGLDVDARTAARVVAGIIGQMGRMLDPAAGVCFAELLVRVHEIGLAHAPAGAE